MKVWWLGNKYCQGNFGDILTPHILDYFGIKFEYVNHYSKAEAIGVGSIARRAGDSVMVLGSGIISQSDKLAPKANWKFVRGPYTRNRVRFFGGECPPIYGDPALLLPLLVEPSDKKYSVGFVPHNVDYNEISQKYKNSNVIGLGTRNFRQIIHRITQCETIISSSLHGIICAHSYGIPAAWAKSKVKLKGDNVKFEDYFASVDIDSIQSTYENPRFIEPGTFNSSTIIKIFNEIKNEILL